MFVGKRPDGSIYGTWSCRQPDDADHVGIEEMPDNDPQVVAYTTRPKAVFVDPRDTKIAELGARLATMEAKVGVK